MTLKLTCECGMKLQIREEFAGKRGLCPYCGRSMSIPELHDGPEGPSYNRPDAGQPPLAGPTPPPQPASRVEEEPLDVVEFLDPPSRPIEKAPQTPQTPWFRKMMTALLDPQSIQWLLMIGGGLMVLGIIIWLVSLKVFENQYVLSGALIVLSLCVHAGGCYVSLRTRFKTAGRALTFLGCVVLPLNVWYVNYANLVSLADHLWIGVFLCCLIYGATVYLLKDPLFMYAVEGGITLTLLLLLAALGYGSLDMATTVSLSLLVLALVSIHAERAFPPDGETFSRARFGMPLFWSGHVQLAAALLFLAAAQGVNALYPTAEILGLQWSNIALGQDHWWWLAGGIWLAGAYAYVYSDFVVRKIGLYTYLAAACLIMAELTLVGIDFAPEWLIVVIAISGAAVSGLRLLVVGQNERLARALPPLAMILSSMAVVIGLVVHLRATSGVLAQFDWQLATGWAFVGAMAVAAAATRLSAFIERNVNPRLSAVYFFLSAASVIVGAAGLLREFGLVHWHEQAPLLMVLPVIYLVASHLWRGKPAAWPLGWVAHAAAAVILIHAVGGSVDFVGSMFRPVTGDVVNLLLGIVFIEATVFYALAAYLRRKSANVYLAALALCGAVWEFVGYANIEQGYYTLIYAGMGIGLVAWARAWGVKEGTAYRNSGDSFTRLEGRGKHAYQCGTAILVMAFLAAFLQGTSRLLVGRGTIELSELLALVLTTLAGGLAICLAPRKAERWLHTTATVALAGLSCLTLNVLIDLNPWQKVEIFSVAVGLLMLVASYIGRFREEEPSDAVSVGLWLGSLLAAGALFVAVTYHRSTTGPSGVNEFALLTVSILLLASGCALQFKAPALLGGSTLTLYLALVIAQLAYHSGYATGAYLAIGGATLFGLGVALSMYRERLLELPDKIAKREGVFRIIGWR